MRGFAFITALVVVVAIGLSVLLLPSGKEVGTMFLRDNKYEESRRFFEEQLAAGDSSPEVVTALLRIYIEFGDVDRAIDLVRRYGFAVGESPDVLVQLVELYRQDRRFGLYLSTLERLAVIAPTRERVATLADAYYKAGDMEKRASALKWLLTMEDAPVYRMLELSDLLIARGDYDDAIDTLDRAFVTAPEAVDWSYRLQLFDLSLFQGQDQRAELLGDRLITPDTPDRIAVAFAQSAAARGRAGLAIDLLRRRADLEATSGEWRMTLVFALRQADRDRDAWQDLRRWWDEDRLPATATPDTIDLAVRYGELDLAVAVISQFGLAQVGTSPALLLIGALHRAGRTATVDALIAELGEDTLNGAPILAADIMLARGDTVRAARYAERALAAPPAAIDDRLALADVLRRLSRSEDAFSLIQPYIADPVLPVEGALLLAELYVELDLAEDGFWDVAALLARRSTPRLRAIWAQLALATDRNDLVTEWLAREPDLSAGSVNDLYFVAERRDAWEVAVAAARRLVALEPGDGPAQRLAYALFQLGETEAALAVIEPVVPRLRDAEPLYADILRALGRTDALTSLWSRQVARPELSDDELEGLVYSLLDVGADAVVWDYLLALAAQKGGGWWYTAARSAERLDRADALVALATSRIAEADPGSEEASAIVYSIADIDRAGSLAIIRSLADHAPAVWSDAYAATLRDLGRTRELAEWTTARLAEERDDTRALSLAYTLADLDPRAAADAIAPRARSGREFADLYSELLRRSNRPDKALGFEIALAKDGRFGDAYSRDVAYRALEAGKRSAAEELLRTTAIDAAPDAESVRQLFYLWGPRPRPEALDWIEARARAASGNARHQWVDKLIEVRAGARAAAIIGGLDGAGGERELLQLTRAYAQGDDREKLRRAVAAAVSRIKDTETLRTLARVAEGTRDRGLITDAWQAVLNTAAADREARRTLGLIAYDESRLIDAERHLGAYLANGEGDYEANYFFADTLARTNRQGQSVPYYRRALALLTAIEPRDFAQEVTRANLLRRLGKTEEAVDLMDSLVRQRPGDDGLRADFADLLIEKGDLRRARTILQLK